jgi:hypothetical protein
MTSTTATTPRSAEQPAFTDDQVMLTLALSAYRGFAYTTPVVTRRGQLRTSLADALRTLPPLRNRFRLVWGPATFRAPLHLFDNAAMFVVTDSQRAGRYVVVIRGTNPVSAFDWVFGDFWTSRLVPWTFDGSTGSSVPKISLSTALGLAVLRLMRSPAAAPGLQGKAWQLISEGIADPAFRFSSGPIQPVTDALGILGRLSPLLRARVRGLERALRTLPADPEERVMRLIRIWQSPTVRSLMERLDALDASSDDLHLALLRILGGWAVIRSLATPGPNLMEFLRGQAREAQAPIEVVVAGHSKGGGLAPALALWLAETRQESWDPSGEAKVSCFAFAGPTAGNRAFANRLDSVLGARNRRVLNVLDVVPHAWMFRGDGANGGPYVDDVPDLYPPPVQTMKTLSLLAEIVRSEVAQLDYAHPVANVLELRSQPAAVGRSWFAQMTHQHTDAYIIEMGLADVMDPDWFFQVR